MPRLCTYQESPYKIHPTVQGETPSSACSQQNAFLGGSGFTNTATSCTVTGINGSTRSGTFSIINHCTAYNPDTDGINWYDSTVLLQAVLIAACVVMLVMGYRMGDKT